MNIQTNIGREFLNLVSKHFPKNHRYSKIFNKNNTKVSNSCTDNLQTIIKKHQRNIRVSVYVCFERTERICFQSKSRNLHTVTALVKRL